MKTFLLFLTLFAFLQSAFLPVNMVAVLLIARSLAVEGRENLFLAFFGGLILSFLSQANLGFYPVIFLLVVKLASMIKKLPLSFNPLMIFLSGGLLITLTAFLNYLLLGQILEIYPRLIEAILIWPAYYLVKMWEERFTVKSNMRLKIGK